VTTGQAAQQSIFVTGTSVFVALSMAVAFHKLQQGGWSSFILHFHWLEFLIIMTFVEQPTPLGWIKIIA